GQNYSGGSVAASAGGRVRFNVYENITPLSVLTVDSKSSMEIGTAGGATLGAITLDNASAAIEGDGTLAAPVINNGTIYAFNNPAGQNTLEVTGALTGSGIDYLNVGFISGGSLTPGSVLQVDSSASASQVFVFASASTASIAPSLRLLSPSTFKGSLVSFTSVGDSVELVGQTVTGASITGSTLTVNVAGGSPFNFNLLSTPSSTLVSWSGDKVAVSGVAGVARTMVWTGSSNSTSFGSQNNWDDITDGLNPASSAPALADTAEFIGGGSPVTGTGTVVALSFTGNGAWNLMSGATLTSTGSVVVGSTQPAGVALDSASSLIANGAAGVVIANTAAASGSSVNVTGAGSQLQIAGALIVGDTAATGSLGIAAGATVTAASLDAGALAGAAGIVTVSGVNSNLITTGSFAAGDAGVGEVAILNGATVNIGGNLNIGQLAGGSGVVDVEDTTGTVILGGNINIGLGGGAAEFIV